MNKSIKNIKRTPRTYYYAYASVFRKTREGFGGLSNMASGFPLKVNGIYIPTSEALYQALRYPRLPDVQKEIVTQNSGMSAKMKSKKHYNESREDWEEIKVNVMRWCLDVKLAQNFLKLGLLLESTGQSDIVEESSKDDFWGAIRVDEATLVGINALGRLLMGLRQKYQSEQRFNLLYVKKLKIPDFTLFGEPIQDIDEREPFIAYITQHWKEDDSNIPEFKALVISDDNKKSGITSNINPKSHQRVLGLTEKEISTEQ